MYRLSGTLPRRVGTSSAANAVSSAATSVCSVLTRTQSGGARKLLCRIASHRAEHFSKSSRTKGSDTLYVTLSRSASSEKPSPESSAHAARRSTAFTIPAALALPMRRVSATDSFTAACTGTPSIYRA